MPKTNNTRQPNTAMNPRVNTASGSLPMLSMPTTSSNNIGLSGRKPHFPWAALAATISRRHDRSSHKPTEHLNPKPNLPDEKTPSPIPETAHIVKWTSPTTQSPQQPRLAPEANAASHPIAEWNFQDVRAEKKATMINGPVFNFSENPMLFSQTKLHFSRTTATDEAFMLNGALDGDPQSVLDAMGMRILGRK